MARDDHNDTRAEFLRRLVLARVPEATVEEIAAAFADDAADANADVLAEIADAVGGAIEALEERLTELEKNVTRGRVH